MDSLPRDAGLLPADTLTDKAYRALEEDIVTLRIPPGTVVSEAILSRRLGVGRTPVREALQRLAREWLVTILPRRGIVVSEIDPIRQLRLLEARREIERFLARAAAKRATPAQRRQFHDLAAAMDHAATDHAATDQAATDHAATGADDIAFMRLDRAFNQLLLQAAGNEFAAAAMAQMNGLSRRFWYVHYRQAADLPLAARLHATIARAIADGDEARAGQGSDALVSYIQAFARATIE